MNKVYKIVWHALKRQWVVVSELAKKGKTKSIKLLALAALASLSSVVMAVCYNTGHHFTANLGSSCTLPSSINNGIPSNFHDDHVVVVNTGAKASSSGDINISSVGSNNALIIGTHTRDDEALAEATIGGNLTITHYNNP
ncbi:MAG: ESPR domain-containing protein, partial [Snodgrassella sp.]|nr:ESPR domain-containing protein [Snodgrassella sp.]